MSQDGVIRVQCLQFTRSSVATVSIFRCLHYFRYRPLDRWRHNGHVVVCGSWCRVLESGCRGAIVSHLTQAGTICHQLPAISCTMMDKSPPFTINSLQVQSTRLVRDQRPGLAVSSVPVPLCWWYLSSRWWPGQGPAFQLFVPLGTFSNTAVPD